MKETSVKPKDQQTDEQAPPAPGKNDNRRWRIHVAWGCVVVIVAVLAFACGAELMRFLRCEEVKPYAHVIEEEGESFERPEENVRELIVENNGWIPAEPYYALYEAGKVTSLLVFMGQEDIAVFDIGQLPPRINADLKRNAPIILFYRNGPGGTWVSYCNGTSELLRGPNAQMAQWFYTARKMRAAGYPTWGSVKERHEWVQRNRGNLSWDAQHGMYILKRTDVQTVPSKNVTGRSVPSSRPQRSPR